MEYTLGIDLHKRSSVWVLLDKEKRVRFEQTLPATRSAIPGAVATLGVPAHEVCAVVEPVCGWRWYAEALEAAGLSVKIANPSKIRLIADSRAKTDRNDARTLADLLRADFLPESYRAPDDIVLLRSLVRERAYLIMIQTGLKNRLQAIVLRSGYLEYAVHPLLARNREALHALGDPEIERMYDLLLNIAERIKPLEQELTHRMKAHPVGILLMTMPGVGIVTASAIVAEVGDFTRFRTAQKLASYAGLVPSERSSGAMTRLGHITKRGSRILRYSLVEAAFRVRPQHALYTFYERLVPKTGKKRARVALARKMLIIMWTMVHKNEPYNQDRIGCMTKRDDLASAFLTQ